MTETLGKRLSIAMTEAGKSNGDIARATNKHVGTVSGWRNDKINPTDANLERIAPVVGRSVRWLRYGDEPIRATSTTEAVGRSTASATIGRVSGYDAGYAAGVFDSIAADARHIMQKAEAASARMRAPSLEQSIVPRSEADNPHAPLPSTAFLPPDRMARVEDLEEEETTEAITRKSSEPTKRKRA